MIDDQCPHCKEQAWPGEDREEMTCKHCGKQYMGVQFGWCWSNVKLPHDCSEFPHPSGLCDMCGTSNEASTKARITALEEMGEAGEPLAEVLKGTLEDSIKKEQS